jgi:diguanylate cyclase (GGDEF)-like protein
MDPASRDVPPVAALRRGERFALRAALAVLVLVVMAGAANELVGFGGAAVETWIRTWASSAVYVAAAAIVVLRAVRVPQRRGAWILLAAGLSLYGAGNIVWAVFYDHLEAPAIPSISDGLWLALYPASYVGLVLLARDKGRAVPAGVWLDGIIAGLGFAALGAAVVFGPVLASTVGSPAAVATNLAYPIADLLLAALVLGLLALRGWRLDRMWALLGAGFTLLYVADSIYLLRVADGAVQVSLLPNIFYLGGVVALAFAAWQPQRDADDLRIERWSVLIVPVTCVMTAIGLLVYGQFAHLDGLAVVLATLTLLLAMSRTALTFRDVRALAVTRREALTDDLTSLPNRRRFLRAVHDAIDGEPLTGAGLALLLLDLDQFKKLNDTLGHHAGDVLLCMIGPRVRPLLREQDMLARLGGDEFGILLAAPCGEAAAVAVADRVIDALREPFAVEGLQLHVGASIGIALFPQHSADARQLLRHADVAMYQAKIGRTSHELYASEQDQNSRDALALASQLPAAIADDQLEVRFQPKAEAASGKIVGMEALVRWQHPDLGLLAPLAFVGLAEQAGLMRELTRTVVAGALDACRRWRAAGHDVTVAVNVSFTDLLDAQFPLEIAAALAQHCVEPHALILEVTESSIMSDAERIHDVLARLDELGVQISLDDFGTGYSSLTHLKALPVTEVKIDRSFVAHMQSDATDHAIVRSTIALAHNLGMRAVAEGVEDQMTWDTLRHLGCELIQGYHLSRPLTPADADTFLAERATARTVAPLAGTSVGPLRTGASGRPTGDSVKRSATAVRNASSSSEASAAPRQRCAPPPNGR